VGSYSSLKKGIESLKKFRNKITKEELENIASFNIITAEADTFYIESENINVISINDLFFDENFIV
jgi:hypothetical protein